MSVALPHVVLVGPPGAGKTTIGKIVAERLQADYFDLDAVIEDEAGRSIPAIFEQDGESHFRDLETSALVRALGRSNSVLALGGGTPVREENQRQLGEYVDRGGAVIFLDVSADTALERLRRSATQRPLLRDNPEEKYAQIMRTRRSIYENIATLQIDTSNRPPSHTAELICTHLLERFTRNE